jgi:putative ABC transport system permease protein
VLARGLSVLMETMLAQDLSTMRVPPNLVVVSAATGVGATLVAALMPAWQAGRTSPLEALRSRARTSEGWLVQKGWILGLPLLAISAVLLILNPFPYDVQFRLGSMVVFSLFCGATLMIPVSVEAWEQLTRPLVQLFYGGSGRLGSRNIQRAKLRTTLTVAALMIGVAMIIIVRGMTASFKNDLQAWLDAYVGGDLYVGSSLPMRSRVWKRLESVPGVAVVAPIRYLDVTWEKPDGNEEKLSYMAIDPLMHGQVTSFVFSQDGVQPEQALQRLNAGRAVFVSSVLAEKNKLARGDSIRLRTRAGPRDFEIAAVVVDFYNQGLVVNGSWEDMRRYFRVADANAFLLRVQPGYQPDAVRQVIDDLYGERDDLIVESNRTIKERVFRLMDQAFSMFDVLALIAVFVAALGVINTLTQNVMERTQEIGMLRAVGMTRRQIVSMVLAEAGVLGVMAGITGLLFGVTLARIFLIAMTAMSGYRLTYVMPAQGVAVALIIAIVVSQLAALLPARRAASIRIMEAVHYE